MNTPPMRLFTFTIAALLIWTGSGCLTASAWTTQDIDRVLAEFPSGTVHQHQMMTMRDGVKLSTHLFLPAAHETNRYPVVLLRSAYNYWPQRATYANDVVNQRDRTWINTNGYVYAMQDLRGDGDSEKNADFDPRLSENEIEDTYDTVEALASNCWCNGRVGLYGNSGHGVAAYMGWLSRAPHLIAVVPNNTAPNLFEHWSFENGVRRWSYNWLQYRYPGEPKRPEWPKPTLGDYYPRDIWMKHLRDGAKSNTTVLIAGDSWHNFFRDSAVEVFSALGPGNHAFLSMEPGTHQGNSDSNGLVFPRKPLVGNITPPTLFQLLDGVSYTNRPLLKYFVMGDARRAQSQGNFYRIVEHWPPASKPEDYYLHADGSLSPIRPTEEDARLCYLYHPTNPVPTVGGNFSFGWMDPSGPLDQRAPQLTNRTDILRFESAPFQQATEFTGPFRATLFVSTDVPDSTFMVKLIDVYPAEGTNDEYHALMRESAIMARYANGFDQPAPLVSGQVYRLDIAMPSLALMVETNHRLAVHVTSSSAPAFEVHPNTYEPVMDYTHSPTAHHALYLNGNHASFIRLPHVMAATEP